MNEQINWSPGVTLAAVEKQTILLAFRFYRGNKTATANALDIAIRTLDNKLNQYLNEDKEQAKRDADLKKQREEFLARSRGLMPAAEGGESVSGAHAGVRMEPTQGNAQEPALSLSQRPQVQTLSPGHTAQGHSRKAR